MKKSSVAISAICFNILLYLVISVALTDLVAAFPDTPEETVLLILTLPNLTGMIGIVLTAPILKLVPQRVACLGALLLMLVGGGLSFWFSENLPALLLAAGLMGLAYGGLSTLFPLMVNRNVPPEQTAAVMGLGAGMIQLGRLVSMWIGGYLADLHWSYVYGTFVFALAGMGLVWRCLPKVPTQPQPDRAAPNLRKLLKNGALWRLCGVGCIFPILYFITSTHASPYIEGYGLGSAATTGMLSAVSMILAALVAVFFGKIQAVTQWRTSAIAFVVMGAGFVVAGVWISIGGITAALLTGAFGIALFSPNMNWAATVISAPENTPMAVVLVLAAINIGYFVSPYVTNALGMLIGDGSRASVFLAAGLAAIVLGIVEWILERPKAAQVEKA